MMVIVRVLLITMMMSGGVIFGMQDEQSLINKPLGEWVKSYENNGRSIDDAIGDYHKENPSFGELYGPRDAELKRIIKEGHSMFEHIAPKIRTLAEKDKGWKKIVDRACYTEPLFYMINRNLDNYAREKSGFDLLVRNEGCYIYLELAAAILGTPGAIAFGRECIKQDSSKKRLKGFLFTIVKYGGSRSYSCENCLSWPDEDVDVVKAGLEMGLDPCMLSDDDAFSWSEGTPLLLTAVEANKVNVVELLLDRGVDIETKLTYTTEFIDSFDTVPRYTQSYTALYVAAERGSQDTVDLLIKRGADVNATDTFGRTPLIIAAKRGYAAIVEKLFDAKAVVWLFDGFDKTALDYAQEGLSSKNNKQKKDYEMIVQLLKDAGAQ